MLMPGGSHANRSWWSSQGTKAEDHTPQIVSTEMGPAKASLCPADFVLFQYVTAVHGVTKTRTWLRDWKTKEGTLHVFSPVPTTAAITQQSTKHQPGFFVFPLREVELGWETREGKNDSSSKALKERQSDHYLCVLQMRKLRLRELLLGHVSPMITSSRAGARTQDWLQSPLVSHLYLQPAHK